MASAPKVGLLVVGFSGLLFGAYTFLGKSMFAPKTQTFYAEFADAAGLTAGSQVLLAGVKIGQVSSVKLANNSKAVVELAIQDGVGLPKSSSALLPTSLIGIGDRQIEIVATTPDSGTLEVGATIPGRLKTPLEGMAPESGKTLEEVNLTLAAMRKLMEDRELKDSLTGLMKESKNTAAQFGSLATRMDNLIAQNQAALGGMMNNANTTMSSVAKMAKNGEKIVVDIQSVSREFAAYAKSGKMQNGVDGIMGKMNEALENGNALLADMKAMLANPQTQENLKMIVANTKSMSDSGVGIAKNAEIMTEKGIILGDKAIEIATKASKFADQASELMDIVKEKLKNLPTSLGSVGAAGLGTIESRADLFRESDPNRWRSEVNFKLPMKERNLHFGIYDAFETNKLTAQLGFPLGKDSEFRAGMFAGKVGVGVDSKLASKLRLRSDLFDLNKPRFDLKANYDLGKGLTGWVGFERVFERNSPTIGIGIKR